jgi:hypothetical protein
VVNAFFCGGSCFLLYFIDLVLNDTIAGFAHEVRRKLDHHQVLFKIEIIFFFCMMQILLINF